MERQEFWAWYLNENHVTEIWPIVGSEAAAELDRMNKSATDGKVLKFGRLTGAQRSHCVLLMRIGNLTIAEWSHEGAVRFWYADNPRTPSLYQFNYRATNLRDHSNWDRSHQSYWQIDVNNRVAGVTNIRQPNW